MNYRKYLFPAFLLISIISSSFSFVQAQNSSACPVTTPLEMVIGDQGRVLPGGANRVRSAPTTSGAQVSLMEGGSVFEVIGGPECGGGYRWWQVSFEGTEGWTVEGNDTEYFLEPIVVDTSTSTPTPQPNTGGTDCALEPRLVVGQEGRLTTTTPSRVRDSASASGAQVGQIQPLDTFSVLEGPVCAQGINWWRISVGRLEGWTAEGVDGTYLTEPIIAEPISDECLMEPRLQVGSNGIVTSNTPIRLRFSPRTSGAAITSLNPQYPFTTLEGPECIEGINWWRISIVTSGTTTVDGWIAEGLDGVYFVERIIPTPTPTPAYIGLPMPTGIEWNSDGSLIAVPTQNDGIYVYDTSDWAQPPAHILQGITIPALAFHPQEPDQAAIARRDDRANILLIDISTGDEISALARTMSTGSYSWVQFSTDGSMIAYDRNSEFVAQSLGDDGFFFSISPPLSNESGYYHFHRMTMSGDGAWMAGTILVESSAYIPNDPTITGTPPVKLHSYLFVGEVGSENLIGFEDGRISEPITTLAFNADANMIVLGDFVGSLRTYTRPEGSESFSRYNSLIRGQPSSTSNRIYALAFDPITGAIVTAEGVPNAVVRVFNPDSLTQIAGWSGAESTSVATDLAFSPDGSLLAIIVDDTVLILDTSDYSEVATLVVQRN